MFAGVAAAMFMQGSTPAVAPPDPNTRLGGVSVPSIDPTSSLWLRVPPDRELQRLVNGMRPDLRRAGGPAEAIIQCDVSADGSLGACVIASETPERSGLGRGALRLMPKFRLVNVSDLPSGETGAIRIPFRLTPSRLR